MSERVEPGGLVRIAPDAGRLVSTALCARPQCSVEAMAAHLPGETYRITDPIENLQLSVTLRRRATEGERRVKADGSAGDRPGRRFLPKRGNRGSSAASVPVTAEQPGSDEEVDEDEGEEAGEGTRLKVETEEAEQLLCPPRTFRWQEKVFSRAEVDRIRKMAGQSDQQQGRRRSLLGAAAALGERLLREGPGELPKMSNRIRAEILATGATARTRARSSIHMCTPSSMLTLTSGRSRTRTQRRSR